MPFPKSVDTIFDLHKKGFKPADGAAPKYFAAVGRFIVAFSANIDGTLNACLKEQIVSDEVEIPSLLIGEMRGGDVIANLRRIIATRKVDETTVKEIDQIFSEIEPLRRVRDVVAHRACMVKGQTMAFHNVALARTDAALSVDMFTVKELQEFTDYSKRLSYRIIKALVKLEPKLISPVHKALIGYFVHTAIAHGIDELAKAGTVKAERATKLKEMLQTAYKAVNAYSDAVQKLKGDLDIYDLEAECRAALRPLMAECQLTGAPEGAALLEIPARLRKPDRSDRAGTDRSRPRQRHASRA